MTRSSGSQQAQEPQTVAGVPRLFVGQIPTSAHEQDLLPLFSKHGEVESIMVVRGSDQKSRGCAMVQFKRWAAAESAAEALHGTAPLEGSKGRHIVINFARPRKGSATTPAEPAIIPRRLFVGQIPAECGADELRALLGRFGDIESLSLTEAKPGVPGWAHVQFVRWTACEAAIDELDQRHTLPGAAAPLTVRFIDIRRPDAGAISLSQQPASSDSSQSHFAHPMANYAGNRRGGAPHPQNFYVPPHYAAMMQMQGAHYMMQGYPQGYPQHMAAGAVMGYPPPMDPSTGSPVHKGQGQSSDGGSRGGRGSGGRRTPSSGGPSSRHGLGSAGSSDSLGNISDASATDPAQQGGAPMPQMHPAMMGGDPAALAAAAAAMGHPQQYIHPAYYPMYAMPHMAPPHGRKVGRGVADPAVYQHKLFVGQVPFEATEQDLWHMFAPFGDILELAVLRSAGVSKGCAFLTYATRAQAVHAMTALNGHQVGTNKRLVVKFADHKPNGNAGGAMAAGAAAKKQPQQFEAEGVEPQEESPDAAPMASTEP